MTEAETYPHPTNKLSRKKDRKKIKIVRKFRKKESTGVSHKPLKRHKCAEAGSLDGLLDFLILFFLSLRLEIKMQSKNKKHQHVLRAIEECRSIVLHAVEFEVQGFSYWESLRSRILRAFGDKGLTGQVNHLFNETKETGGDHE